MSGPTPIVRQAVLCERVTYTHGTGYTLINPRVDFVALPGEPLPYRPEELWLFLQVGGSYGSQAFQIKLFDVTDLAQPVPVYSTPERRIDLGRPPGRFRRRTRSWSIKLGMVPFPRPGWYEFWVVFDGLPQARVPVLMEAAE